MRTLQGAYRRGNTYQSLLAQLESVDTYDTFRDWLTANPQLNVSIRAEGLLRQPVTDPDAPIQTILPYSRAMESARCSALIRVHRRSTRAREIASAALHWVRPSSGRRVGFDGVDDSRTIGGASHGAAAYFGLTATRHPR